jgi:hypothetical protein
MFDEAKEVFLTLHGEEWTKEDVLRVACEINSFENV